MFSLNSIPPCHQFLDCTELEKFGQECVQQLLELLEKLLLALHKLSPSKENAKENAAVTMRKIGERRGNGKELEVRVEGAPSPKKQRRLLEAGAVEPVRHRQETLDLAAWRNRATLPVLSGGPSAPG